MVFGGKAVLGLAVEEGAVLAAEVAASGHGAALRRAAVFDLPAGAWENPAAAGKALGRWLKAQGFSARTAALGAPARWMLSRDALFPAAGAAAVNSMARLEAERALSARMEPWIVDYVSQPLADGRVSALICAVDRDKASGAQALARAAGLKPRSLAPSALALAWAMREASWDVLLWPRAGGVEVVARSGRRIVAARHAPLPAVGSKERAAALGATVARVVALAPGQGGGAARGVAVCGNEALPEGLGAGFEAGLACLGLKAPSGIADGDRFAPAAALALAALRGQEPPVNFLRPRFAAAARPRWGRRLGWGLAAAAAALIAGGAFAESWRRDAEELAELQARLEAMRPDVEAAREVARKVALARGWTDRRPKALDPLRELALAFPVESRAWLTSLALSHDRRVVVAGKAADERAALAVLDRIRACRAFGDVSTLYVREAGGAAPEVAFSFTFRCLNRE